MTESEKQLYINTSQKVIDVLTPLLQSQQEQANNFALQVDAMYPAGQPSDVVSHKAGFDIGLFLARMQDNVRQGERLLRTHSDVVVYLQNSDVVELTLEDVLSMLDKARKSK